MRGQRVVVRSCDERIAGSPDRWRMMKSIYSCKIRGFWSPVRPRRTFRPHSAHALLGLLFLCCLRSSSPIPSLSISPYRRVCYCEPSVDSVTTLKVPGTTFEDGSVIVLLQLFNPSLPWDFSGSLHSPPPRSH